MHGGTEAGGAIPAGGAGIMAGRRRSRSLSTLGLIGEKGFHSVNTTPATGPPNMAGLNGVGTKLVDQRLDPSQLYLRYDPDTGSSRMSVRSLRDDADYSRRVLRVSLIPSNIYNYMLTGDVSISLRILMTSSGHSTRKRLIVSCNKIWVVSVISVGLGFKRGQVTSAEVFRSPSLFLGSGFCFSYVFLA